MLSIDNTVLLVIDFQDKLMPAIFNHEVLVKKAAACIAGCKLLNIPILTMQQYTKGLGETVRPLQNALDVFEPIEKITFSCCKNAEFVDKLKRLKRKNIIITGIEAHICVQQTVLDLLEAEYNVYVAADCIGSRNETDRMYAEKRMENAGAVFSTMESFLFELLVKADHPKRKDITNLIVNL